MQKKRSTPMENTNAFRELRQASGMSQRKFASYFGIPRRTIENWDSGDRACPTYTLELMKYKLIKEGIIKEELT
jgi:DNA-binding transcriptional regulator YiaG